MKRLEDFWSWATDFGLASVNFVTGKPLTKSHEAEPSDDPGHCITCRQSIVKINSMQWTHV